MLLYYLEKDCSRVSCYKPACDEYYEELYVPYGECCPKCRPKGVLL